MIRMNSPDVAAYRYLGCVGSCFTFCQSIVWLMLALGAAMCKYFGCGSSDSKQTFKYCFYLLYYYEPQNITANSTRVNFITPITFHGIMWFNVLLCIGCIAISGLTAKAFIQWNKPKVVRKLAFIWTRCILAFSVCEFILFIVFASDISSINKNKDMNCLLEINLTLFQASYTPVRTPAPYLLQLKSSLKTIRKKIRKYQKNLEFMNSVFNKKSPDHVNNPFISKIVVENYVEDIWKSMFNNSIRDKVPRNSDDLPLDKVMRNFVVNKHLDLDDTDLDLLKNFDGLTHKKWTKPIPSSNVIFGRQYNLSTSITNDDSVTLDKLARLLHEYYKGVDEMPPGNYTQGDENFDNFFKQILAELEDQDTHLVHDKNKIVNILDKVDQLTKENDNSVPNNNEQFLLSLRKSFEDMVAPKENSDNETKINKQNMQSVIKDIKEFLKNNKALKISDDEILNNIKKSLEYHYDHKISPNQTTKNIVKGAKRKFRKGHNHFPVASNLYRRESDYYNEENDYSSEEEEKLTTTQTPTTTKSTSESGLVKELCDNCAYFILGPSIVCMILSLKTGIVWLLNITVAILILYYGRKIELKTKCKFLPFLSKKERTGKSFMKK